jgi:hypothetical protein
MIVLHTFRLEFHAPGGNYLGHRDSHATMTLEATRWWYIPPRA